MSDSRAISNNQSPSFKSYLNDLRLLQLAYRCLRPLQGSSYPVCWPIFSYKRRTTFDLTLDSWSRSWIFILLRPDRILEIQKLESRSFETSQPTTLIPLFFSMVGFSPLGLIEVAMTSQPLFFKSCARMNPNPESQPYMGSKMDRSAENSSLSGKY